MSKIIIAGMDGSLRNFGMTKMTLDIETGALDIIDLRLAQTEKSKVKTVRASSDTLIRAQSLRKEITAFLTDVNICFAEVPFGGQSYDAVLGFGIVIGLYASVPVPLIEVSPSETKLATVGTKTASKEEMIEWAFSTYPKAPWIRHKKNGKGFSKGEPTKANEHLADGAAIVHAGIRTPAFQQVTAILKTRFAA